MSYCKSEGKDKIIFATKEDHDIESTVSLGEEDEAAGLILPNGEINWGCPCLGGMATGPCGVEFRDAFSCFHYSKAEPKGSDCYEAFKIMQDCMTQYPAVYNAGTDDDDDKDELGMKSLEPGSQDDTSEKPGKDIAAAITEFSSNQIETEKVLVEDGSNKKS